MRRLIGILGRVAALLSLTLCVAVALAWVRNGWKSEGCTRSNFGAASFFFTLPAR